MNELKPCPFCGSSTLETIIEENNINIDTLAADAYATVKCHMCRAEGGRIRIINPLDKQESEKAFNLAERIWNTRKDI